MSVKTFWDWLDNLPQSERTDYFDCTLQEAGNRVWEAATKAAEEKFISTNSENSTQQAKGE